MIKDVLTKIDDSYTIRKLEEMIGINSVVGHEGELAEYLLGELEALGLKTETQEVEPGRPNVYGRLKGLKLGKRLNFDGHLDTVPVVDGWDTDPFKPVREGDKLHGLGSCDMKAGIASILTMFKAIHDSGHRFWGELSFSGVVDEEAYGKGAKAMLRTDFGKVDAIVLGEANNGEEGSEIHLGITGKILYDIHVKGRAAHGFNPEEGINAIEEAGVILTNLGKLRFKDHPRFGRGNYSTLKIEGGYKVYSVVVPASCRFEVNRLLVPGETVEYAVKDMMRLVKSLKLRSDVEVKTKPPFYAAYEMKSGEPIIKIFDEVYRKVVGKAPLYNYSKSITDANTFTGEGGIPCLHLGPKPGAAHQKNEYVELDWLPPVSKMYALIVARFLE